MNPTKHTLLRPRSLAAGLVACAALGVTAPSALADVNVVAPEAGVISIAGTGASEYLKLTYDPQHPKDLLIGANVPLSSFFCEDDVFNGGAVLRCPDVTRVKIDLSTSNDGIDVVGAVKYRIEWTGAPGDDVVDLQGSTGTNWIEAAPDTGADKYTLTPKTTLSYSGRNTSVQIDHSQPGNDGGNAGGENDAVSGGHGSTYQLTQADDVYFGAPSELSETVIGGEGDDYLFGGGGDDDLRGYGGNDTVDGTGKLDGGDGHDSLLLHGNNGKPRALTGGAGIDKVAVGGPQAGGMVVTSTASRTTAMPASRSRRTSAATSRTSTRPGTTSASPTRSSARPPRTAS
jgi:hypothetical protein